MSARIGLISYGTDRPTSGITRYTQEMLVALNESQLHLTVLHAGCAASRDGVVPLRGASRVPGLLTIGQAEIAWSAHRHGLSLVHDPTGLVPLIATRAKRIATIHDVIPYIYPDASTMMNRIITRRWLPLAARGLDAIITDSEQSKTDIVRYLGVRPGRVEVIPLGVDERYQPVSPSAIAAVVDRLGITFPYILFVSAVEPRKKRKNLLGVLEAYAQVRGWSDRWKLVVAGRVQKDFTPVFETINRLGLEPHVHFTDFVDEADLPALYSGADLFVMPSLYEGFGFPVLEAMASGAPVVTSSTSSLPEVTGDAAILVDPTCTDAIAGAMKRVLSNPCLMAELSAKGRARAVQFTWRRTAHETISVYERVLGHSLL
jgi:glycosyltransferase involved in cell wall biosynthesis